MNINKLFGDVTRIASHHCVPKHQAEEMQTARKNSLIYIALSIVITTLVTLGSNELYNSGILNISNAADNTTGQVNNHGPDNISDISVGQSTESNSTLAEQ